MTDFLNSQFLDNTAQDWIIAAVLVVIVMVMVRTVIAIVLKRLSAIASKTETDVDDLVAELLDKTKFLFVALLALYVGALSLSLPTEVDDLLSTILVLGFLMQGAFWANGIVNYMTETMHVTNPQRHTKTAIHRSYLLVYRLFGSLAVLLRPPG